MDVRRNSHVRPEKKSVKTLPEPEVLYCYFTAGFSPPLSAMALRWPDEALSETSEWLLPAGTRLIGPAPRRFGVSIQRWADDAFTVCLVWDSACFRWPALTQLQLLTSDLAAVLRAMGTDVQYLLRQPIVPSARAVAGAA
jgi:hypothetical protein